MCQVDKPYKSLDELIDILEHKHKLIIENRDIAKGVLTFIPYYDLINGYKDHFMKKDSDEFKDSITFSFLYMFYTFDHGFQNILFEFSIIIESYFKIALARVISEHIGYLESDYLNPDNYLHSKGNVSRKKLFDKLNNLSQRSTENPTYYYRTHHGHVPPWILLKNVTFSNAINLFRLLPRKAKSDLLKLFLPIDVSDDQKIPLFIYILTLIRKTRNVIAHNLKFTTFSCRGYGKNLNKAALRQLISSSLLNDDELHSEIGLYGIYGYIYFSLALIPNSFIKIKLCANILNHIKSFNISTSDKKLSTNWEILAISYFNSIGIPIDIPRRLSKYIVDSSNSTIGKIADNTKIKVTN